MSESWHGRTCRSRGGTAGNALTGLEQMAEGEKITYTHTYAHILTLKAVESSLRRLSRLTITIPYYLLFLVCRFLFISLREHSAVCNIFWNAGFEGRVGEFRRDHSDSVESEHRCDGRLPSHLPGSAHRLTNDISLGACRCSRAQPHGARIKAHQLLHRLPPSLCTRTITAEIVASLGTLTELSELQYEHNYVMILAL